MAIAHATNQEYQFVSDDIGQLQVTDDVVGGSASQSYSTYLTGVSLGTAVDLLDAIQLYQNWLNTLTAGGAASKSSDVVLQFQKYCVCNLKSSYVIKNQTNSVAYYKAWKVKARYDLPAGQVAYSGSAQAPLAAVGVIGTYRSGFQQVGQDAGGTQKTIWAPLHKDATPFMSPLFCKFFKIVRTVKGKLNPGKEVTFAQSSRPMIPVDGVKYGGYPAASATSSFYCFKKDYSAWLIQLQGEPVHYPAGTTSPAQFGLTLPLFQYVYKERATIYSLRSADPTFDLTDGGYGTATVLAPAAGPPTSVLPTYGSFNVYGGATSTVLNANYVAS